MTEEPRIEETVTSEEKLEETVVDAKTERSIADELAKMGAQVAAAAKTAWESEERRKLQHEVTTGVQRFGQELTTALTKATESEAPVTDTSAGETVVVAETPVVPDVTGDEETPVA